MPQDELRAGAIYWRTTAAGSDCLQLPDVNKLYIFYMYGLQVKQSFIWHILKAMQTISQVSSLYAKLG